MRDSRIIWQVRQWLALGHVVSGSAEDTLGTLKEILDDIDSIHTALGKDTASAAIVAKLQCLIVIQQKSFSMMCYMISELMFFLL